MAGRLTMLSCPFFRLLNVFNGTDMLGDDQGPRDSSLRVLPLKTSGGGHCRLYSDLQAA